MVSCICFCGFGNFREVKNWKHWTAQISSEPSNHANASRFLKRRSPDANRGPFRLARAVVSWIFVDDWGIFVKNPFKFQLTIGPSGNFNFIRTSETIFESLFWCLVIFLTALSPGFKTTLAGLEQGPARYGASLVCPFTSSVKWRMNPADEHFEKWVSDWILEFETLSFRLTRFLKEARFRFF